MWEQMPGCVRGPFRGKFGRGSPPPLTPNVRSPVPRPMDRRQKPPRRCRSPRRCEADNETPRRGGETPTHSIVSRASIPSDQVPILSLKSWNYQTIQTIDPVAGIFRKHAEISENIPRRQARTPVCTAGS